MSRDLKGYKFGYLTAIMRVDNPRTPKRSDWLCQCACGRNVVVGAGTLLSPLVKAYNCSRQRFDTREGEPRICSKRPASYPYEPQKRVMPLTPDEVARGYDLL